MYISKVSIRNYRNFLNSKFEFKKGINTIIGENGSGKTNLFRAIRLVLDDTLYRFAYQFDESEFNRNIDDWKGHWIIISIEFSELSDDEALQSLFVHGLGNIENNMVEKATYNLFFRPKADIRKKLSELPLGDNDGMEELLDNISIHDYETVFYGKSTADFNDDNSYKELVGDFQNVNFNFEIDQNKFGIKIPNQLSVAKEISFTYIQALRDVVSDFHNNKTNPLLTLLKSQSDKINEKDFEPISEQVKTLNSSIEGLSDVQQIRTDIKDTIKEAVGETYAPSKLSIKSSLSEEADKLLQSLRLFVGEPGEDYEGAIHELSLGGANLIYLTLKLLEYKYRINEDTFANFLLIEEPEAHIHTHIQKTIFGNLDFEDTQIIYSTHSTHISAVSKISRMNILAKKQNYAEVYQPANMLKAKQIVKLERYLDAIRSNLLFAKGVMLVEGDAEEILIPIMIKKVLGISLDELGISIINIRSTGFENVAQIFHDDRVQRKCSIITDLDKSIDGDENDSQKSGLERKEKLEEFTEKNDWIKPFYAKHTFEVDFVTSNNSWEVVQLLSDVYKNEKTIDTATKELESKKVEQYGKRVLTMANNVGKGWFAIMLGEEIFHRTNIPKYILKALSFVCPEVSDDGLARIMEYRIKEYIKNKNADDKTDYATVVENVEHYKKGEIPREEVLEKYNANINDAQFKSFLKMI